MAYEYKTVPAPMVLKVKNEQDAHASIRSYGERINDEAVDGWEPSLRHKLRAVVAEGKR